MLKLTSINPSKEYESLGTVDISTESEISEKVKKANRAVQEWKEIGLRKRLTQLRPIYDKFTEEKERLAELESKEMGMPIKESRIDLDAGLEYFNWYLKNAEKYISPEITFEDDNEIHKVYYEPVGVAAVIVPWNFPFTNFIWGVIPNLVVGNTVVFKHSEEVPLFGKEMEKIIMSSNLSLDIFSEVYGAGDIGEKLVHSDINLICFTGSTKTGTYLYKVAAKKFIRIILEMGGSAPGIVFDDADIDLAVEDVFANRFLNCGQVCDGLKRAIIHKGIAKEFIKRLKERMKKVVVGDAMDEKTDIGPLVAERQVDLLISQVEDAVKKGAKIEEGGDQPESLKGAYYKPTLLVNVTSNMRVWKEEVFGPVLPLVTFETENEAVKLANDTKYGLGGYIYSKDKEKARRVASRIKTGMVSINGVFYVVPYNPFGGCKLSGLGREHGKYGLRELCNIKVVSELK